jgi:hypothetical protein
MHKISILARHNSGVLYTTIDMTPKPVRYGIFVRALALFNLYTTLST